jgi:steroid delta-isomerase-like uncharacterized protein
MGAGELTFELATHLVACARDCLDEPPLFGPRRMVEAAARIASADSDDPALRLLGERIGEQRGALLGMEREELASWLDGLIGELAAEARRRALSRSPEPASAGAIVDSFYDAYNRHDVEGAIALYNEQAEHYEVAQARRTQGRQAIGAGLARFLESFPDAHWRELRRVSGPDAVAVAYTLTGTLAAPMGPYRTPGAALALEGLHLLEIRAGLIVSSTDYWDTGAFARQMTESG